METATYDNFSTNDNYLNLTQNNDSNMIDKLSTPVYLYLWITIVNVVIFIVGTVGNIFVVVIVLKFREMRTLTNLGFVNLSVSDILVLAICQSSALTEFFAKDRWLLGHATCRMIPFLEVLVTHASVLIMLGISYGRYFAVCYPLESYSTCSRSRAYMMMASAWIVAGASAMPFIFMSHTETATFKNDNSQVVICRTHISELWQRLFIVCSFVFFFVVPFCILSFIYSRTIFTIVTESKKIQNVNVSQQSSMKSRQQLVVMLLMIVVLFFLCVLPMRIVIMWVLFTDPSTINSLGLEGYLNIMWIARVLQYTNSAVNPLIYNAFSVKFRKAFAKLLFLDRRKRRSLSLTSASRINGRYTYSFVKTNSKETAFY